MKQNPLILERILRDQDRANIAQLQADVDYIAMMADIDLDNGGNENEPEI